MSDTSLLTQMRQPVLVTAATIPAVSVSALKMHARIDHSHEDALLADYIATASRMVEDDAEIALLTSTWAVYLDDFPCWEIELRKPPVKSITSITYVDTSNATQTLSASAYRADIYHRPARVEPAYQTIWPVSRYQSNTVCVTFVAGETSPSLIDPKATQAIKMLAAHWYIAREAVGEKPGGEVGMSYCALIDRLRWAGNV